MRTIWTGFLGQLRKLVQLRMLMLFLLFLVACWISLGIYRQMIVKDLPIAVLDFDHSSLSRTLVRYLESTKELTVSPDQPTSMEEAEDLLEHEKVCAIVLIPEGLSADVKKGHRSPVVLAVDMSNILTGKNVYKAISKIVGTVSAGVELSVVRKLGEHKEKVMGRVVPISISENFAFNPATNYTIYIMPGLLLFYFHILLLIMATSTFLPENTRISWLELIGKNIAIFLAALPIGLLTFYVLLPQADIIPVSPFGLVMSVLTAFVFMDIMMALAIYSLMPSRLTAMQLTIMLGMLSLMFSGITWPTDMFPEIIQFIAAYIPFTPFAKGYQSFLHYPLRMDETGWIFAYYHKQIVAFIVLILLGAIGKAVLARLTAKGGTP